MPTGIYIRTKPISRIYPDNLMPVNPRMPRDKDLRYKLTVDEIKEIKRLHKTGRYTHQVLADGFGVSTATICYYVNEHFRQYQMEKNRHSIHHQKNYKEYMERKKKILGDEFKKYNALRARKLRGKL
jgi:hypothetical protein